jgi:SAM-dependent methyltransferase
MHQDLAHLWPLISRPQDYADEARHWRDALRDLLGPGRRSLLELGVGGGNNLSHFASDFDPVAAVDLSDGMLAHSRRLNPSVEHHVGDMRTVRLGRTFDAVIAHDAVGYLVSPDDLRAAFATAFVHLRPGGVFVCAPDWFRETFDRPRASVHGPRGDDPELTMTALTFDPDPTDTTLEEHFVFLLRRGRDVEIVEDRHVLGLFPLATWLSLMREAGFAVSKRPYPVHDDGHDAWLLVGRRDTADAETAEDAEIAETT